MERFGLELIICSRYSERTQISALLWHRSEHKPRKTTPAFPGKLSPPVTDAQQCPRMETEQIKVIKNIKMNIAFYYGYWGFSHVPQLRQFQGCHPGPAIETELANSYPLELPFEVFPKLWCHCPGDDVSIPQKPCALCVIPRRHRNAPSFKWHRRKSGVDRFCSALLEIIWVLDLISFSCASRSTAGLPLKATEMSGQKQNGAEGTGWLLFCMSLWGAVVFWGFFQKIVQPHSEFVLWLERE